MAKLTPEYVAGILDGEGYLGITGVRAKSSPTKKHLTIVIVVSMTDRQVPESLQERYGGSLTTVQRAKPWKDVHTWRVYAKAAEKVLHECRPYLLTKSKQADILLELRRSMREGGIMSRGPGFERNPEKDAGIAAFRQQLKAEIHVLNRRGKPTASEASG